ncbi:MAG: cupin domain-containing protein [Anaerolineae bacterium]|jgi:quercetin dioxygenase-like cupin family protein|nr:cupin domain-containing protein [Anaerolineae bacterium]
MNDYTLIPRLTEMLEAIPPESIVSRTFYKEARLKAILFGFDAGQELSEHTSSQTAILQILQGEAILTLGDDRHEVSAGAWIQLAPRLKHRVQAITPVWMLLILVDTVSE